MAVKKICPQCFRETLIDEVCTSCHFDMSQLKTNKNAIPPYTVLHQRYMLGVMIGQGGFGMTYKCLDLQTGKICALKEYFPRYLADHREDFDYLTGEAKADFMHGQRRFKEEGRLLVGLGQRHYQHIISAYDCFDENNTSYYVMKYIYGGDLKAVSKSYHFSVEEVTEIILKIARELYDIHTRDHLLHRDISPENILIQTDYNPVLIDFGSAKFVHTEQQKYTVVLKKQYAPIEQYTATSDQGTYTDIYALAATYYYLVTRKHIPDAPSRVLNKSTYKRLSDYSLGISENLSDIIDYALKPLPQERLQTLEPLIFALEEELNTATTPIKPPRQRTGAKLRLIDEKQGTRRYDIPAGQSISVGRLDVNDVVITSSAISRQKHLVISYLEEEGFFNVEDHSLNGTLIGGRYVQGESVRVRENTVIKFFGSNSIIVLEVAYE